jgi:hypothetical protein
VVGREYLEEKPPVAVVIAHAPTVEDITPEKRWEMAARRLWLKNTYRDSVEIDSGSRLCEGQHRVLPMYLGVSANTGSLLWRYEV